MQTLSASSVPTARARLDWIDQARGLGILLVVIGHALRGLLNADLLAPTPLVMAIDRGIYGFHMPLFFLLAGLTFLPKASLQSFAGFLTTRAERLLWPLCLWTWIFSSLRILAGDYANEGMGWAAFPFWPLPPRDHFWFLWALFLILVLSGLALRWPALALLALFLLLAVAMDPESRVWTEPALRHLPYFAAGIALARCSFSERAARAGPVLVASAAVVFALAVTLAAMGVTVMGYVAALPVGMAAVLGLVTVISAVPSIGIVGTALCVLGKASMAIFLAHTIFSGGIRAVLEALGISDIAAHIVLGVGVGVIGPLVLDRLANWIGLRRMLGF